MEGAEEGAAVRCPVCLRELPGALINSHLDRCLQAGQGDAERGCSPPSKKPRLAAAAPSGETPSAAAPVFSLFHKSRGGGGQSPGAPGEKPEEGGGGAALRGASLAQKLEGKPLADRLRPDTLRDYVGQERVLGAQTLLRSLLESHEIPSLILWGPPGCGKVSEPPAEPRGSTPSAFPGAFPSPINPLRVPLFSIFPRILFCFSTPRVLFWLHADCTHPSSKRQTKSSQPFQLLVAGPGYCMLLFCLF